jgi:ABC-type glycerol-3-phosphate transport system substrate-binding protein
MRLGIGVRLLSLLPAVALLATACSSGAPTTNTSSSGKVVRVLAVAGPETDALIKYAPDFEKSTGITASIEQVARPLWGQRKVRELIENAGLYDVVMTGGGDDNLWVKYKAHVKDLSKLLSADQVDQLILKDKFTYNGKLVGIPQYYNFPMLFYRKDLFNNPTEQANFKAKYGHDLAPPTSYDQMYQIAEFFNRPPNMYGFFIGGVDWSVYLDDTYFVYGLGGNYGDPTSSQLTLNSPQQKQAMNWLVKFSKFNPPGWQTENFFDGDQLVQNGKVAMYQNWFYIWKTFQQKMPDKIGMAPLAGTGAHLGAFVATIPDAAPNAANGAKFIQWMMSAKYQKQQAIETGDLPMRKDVIQDPDVRKALVGIEAFEKVLPNLQYNQTTWVGELSAGVSEAIAKALKGELSPDAAADWLQNEKFKGRKAIE